jgi:hypothetical protein
MDRKERMLLKRTKRFVAATCPKLSAGEHAIVVAKVYNAMRFTLELIKATRADNASVR